MKRKEVARNERAVSKYGKRILVALLTQRFAQSEGGVSAPPEAGLRGTKFRVRSFYAGVHSVGETPVPIPNTAVKPSSADGSAEPSLVRE